MASTLIHWLGEEACHREEVVGGKAASLSRLAAVHRVPHGFAIPALSPDAAPLRPDLAHAVSAAYTALCERLGAADLPVAVRSSALDEDGMSASFAGQHDTYLNIRGRDAVLDAVQRCARSAASTEAISYRTQRGLATDEVRIAVLVQELVQAEVSAVAFSVNPISGGRDEIMINANWGLGESIVGGTATPDTFVVSKRGPELVWSDIAQKQHMTVLAATGTRDVEVPPERRGQPSLEQAQIVEIARLAMSLEATTAHPVDIECAIAGGALHLLQCRPVTTL